MDRDDLAGRITHADCDCAGAAQDSINNATHVAGTLGGDGTLNSTYKGMAPGVEEIIAYVSWDNSGDCIDEYEDAINDCDIDVSDNS